MHPSPHPPRRKDSLGRYGEDLAARHLLAAGYAVIARNWRSPDPAVRGELDIVARLGEVLVFCEVKTRSSAAFGLPAEAVSRDKQARIRRLATSWLNQQNLPWQQVRFDVIAILRPRTGPVAVQHLQGVG